MKETIELHPGDIIAEVIAPYGDKKLKHLMQSRDENDVHIIVLTFTDKSKVIYKHKDNYTYELQK